MQEKRRSIPVEGKKRLDELIRQRILESEAFRRAETVLLYAPVRGEIDLLPLVAVCRKMGKAVGLPVCLEDRKMVFLSLAEGEGLVKGRYGIPVPREGSRPITPDGNTLCILPALTADANGNRLGYGGGYYDRFLEHFAGTTMVAVYEKLTVEQVPTEPHDRRADWLVTESRCSRCEDAHPWDALLKRPREALAQLMTPVRGALRRWMQTDPTAAKGEQTETSAKGVYPRVGAPILVLVTFLLLILSRLIDTALTRRGSEYITVILLQLLIFVLPTVLYLQLKGEQFTKRIRFTPMRPEHAWFCMCALVVMITSGLLISILTGGIESLSGNFTLYNTFVARSDGSVWEMVYLILAYAILPALCEEPIYRAVLCAEYESAGTGVAVTVSALFFAMLHFSLPLFLHYFLMGLILAGVMYATRSTLAAVLLHLAYNLFCLFGRPYLSAFYMNAGSNEIFVFCLITLMLLFAAFGAGEARKIYYLYARANLSSGYTEPVRLSEYPGRIRRVLTTPAVIPVAVVWLIMSVITLAG